VGVPLRQTKRVAEVKHYLERMKIADAKRLADRLGVSLSALLEASISLSQDLVDADVEGLRELPQYHDFDGALAF